MTDKEQLEIFISHHKKIEPDWEHGEIREYEKIPGDEETFFDVTYEDFSTFRYAEIDGKIKMKQMR